LFLNAGGERLKEGLKNLPRNGKETSKDYRSSIKGKSILLQEFLSLASMAWIDRQKKWG